MNLEGTVCMGEGDNDGSQGLYIPRYKPIASVELHASRINLYVTKHLRGLPGFGRAVAKYKGKLAMIYTRFRNVGSCKRGNSGTGFAKAQRAR